MIKFTVVTCTYNAERVLQRTLDSVNKQTYCNIEHLIIDGVSKDKTLAMVRAYQNRAKAGENAHEIVVYSEPDKGLYDAMNKGIDRATGDYLVFLNAKDGDGAGTVPRRSRYRYLHKARPAGSRPRLRIPHIRQG